MQRLQHAYNGLLSVIDTKNNIIDVQDDDIEAADETATLYKKSLKQTKTKAVGFGIGAGGVGVLLGLLIGLLAR